MLWPLVAYLIALGACADNHNRVLVLHSFGHDFSQYDAIASVFRTELARMSPEPLVVSETTLDAARKLTGKEQDAFLEYLRQRFEGAPPTVVVTMGPPAARFYTAHRDKLFPAAALVMGALDARVAKGLPLRPGDAAVVGQVDLPRIFENIVNVAPGTRTIAVVMGASELEKFWLAEVKRDTAPLASRVDFIWLNDLSLEQMKKRVAELPPNTAIFYGLLMSDAAGIPHDRHDALRALHAAANAPIFGLYENELGKGVVGGPLISQRERGERIAAATRRALLGSSGSSPQIDVVGLERPAYDWRELDRWGIDRARLPADGEVRFQAPSLWEEHRVAVVATIAVLLLQSLLIGGLMWHRIRLRRAEQEARGLGGRLITAHEDERRRIARELHDDFTQRLAGLAIETAKVEGALAGHEGHTTAHSIREGLTAMSEDVHAMSYRLHPSVIEDLGLAEALRTECDRFARNEAIRVELDSESVPEGIPAEPALCLFRIAQESLRNVSRHAGASVVDVALHAERDGLALRVRDNGCGFDASSDSGRVSLGLASMRERVRLLGGSIEVDSEPGHGTAVHAWVPLKKAA